MGKKKPTFEEALGRLEEIVEKLEDILAAQRIEALALFRSFGPKGNDGRVELSERERERLEAFASLVVGIEVEDDCHDRHREDPDEDGSLHPLYEEGTC